MVKAYGVLLALSNEKCISLLYNLINKNNMFHILIELFNRVVFLNTVTEIMSYSKCKGK